MFISIILSIFGLAGYLVLSDWLRNSPNSRYIQKLLKQITLKITLNDFEGAQQDLLPLIREKKGGRTTLLLYCQVLRGTKRLEEARLQAIEASRLYPEELNFRLEEAKALYELDRAEEALEAFRVCAPILRDETDLIALGATLFKAKNFGRCREILEPLIPKTQNGHLLALVGDCLYEQKQFSEAITLYRKSLELGFQQYYLWVQLGNAYRRLGNLQESERIFRHLIEKDPADSCATLGLGLCMQERNLHQKALLIYQSSQAWEKKDEKLLYQAALCAFKIRKFAFAESCLTMLIQEHQVTPKYLGYLGYALECQEKWAEAEQIYLRLIDVSPNESQGYRALAWMFGVGNAHTISSEQGIQYAHIALKLQNDVLAWEILSACEARTGNFIKAYHIQERLASLALTPQERNRHFHAMTNLKKNLPLDHSLVVREMVA